MKQFKLEMYSESDSNISKLNWIFTYKLVNLSNSECIYINSGCNKEGYLEVYHGILKLLLTKKFNLEILNINMHKDYCWSTITISDESFLFFKLKYINQTIIIDNTEDYVV